MTGTRTGFGHPMASDHDIRRLDMRWAQAERQVYPLVLADPEAYQRAVVVVRAIADRLQDVATPAGLARAFGQAETLAARAASESGTRADDLDAASLAGAGFRLRYQELLAGPPAAAERAPQ